MSRWQTDSGRWFGRRAQTHSRGRRRVWSSLLRSRAGLTLLGGVSALAIAAVTLALVSVAHAGPSVWTIVSSPDPNATSGNLLLGVAAHSPHDVWAVGD